MSNSIIIPPPVFNWWLCTYFVSGAVAGADSVLLGHGFGLLPKSFLNGHCPPSHPQPAKNRPITASTNEVKIVFLMFISLLLSLNNLKIVVHYQLTVIRHFPFTFHHQLLSELAPFLSLKFTLLILQRLFAKASGFFCKIAASDFVFNGWLIHAYPYWQRGDSR
jgi:hypothetical protein